MTRERLLDTSILWTVNILRFVVRPVGDGALKVADRFHQWDWDLFDIIRGFEHKYGPEQPAAPVPTLTTERSS